MFNFADRWSETYTITQYRFQINKNDIKDWLAKSPDMKCVVGCKKIIASDKESSIY